MGLNCPGPLMGFPGGSMVKNPPASAEMQETRVWFLRQKLPLEKEMATRSVILAWKIPWTEEPGGLQSMGSQRVKLNLVKEPDRNNNKSSLGADRDNLSKEWSPEQSPCGSRERTWCRERRQKDAGVGGTGTTAAPHQAARSYTHAEVHTRQETPARGEQRKS